jgi:hypothetical protein
MPRRLSFHAPVSSHPAWCRCRASSSLGSPSGPGHDATTFEEPKFQTNSYEEIR